jgi:hypothetical protein
MGRDPLGGSVWECECEIREIKVKKRNENEEGRIGRGIRI